MVCPLGAIDLNMANLKKDRRETEEELREVGEDTNRKIQGNRLLKRCTVYNPWNQDH